MFVPPAVTKPIEGTVVIGGGREGLRGDGAAAAGESDKLGYVNRGPVPARSPVRGWGYFLAAFFLRSAQ